MTKPALHKRFLSINVLAGLLELAATSLVSFFVTGFLVKNFGSEIYGVIAVINSIVMFMILGQSTITSSVGRFVMVRINQNQPKEANQYFSTGFWALLTGCFLILFVALIISKNPVLLINSSQINDKSILAYYLTLTVIAGLFRTLVSPFLVATLITHRLYLEKIFFLLGLTLKVCLIFTLLTGDPSDLIWLGLANLGAELLPLVLAIFACFHLMKDLSLKPSLFSINSLKKMSIFGGWSLLDRLSTLLYFNTDLILISFFVGSDLAGLYAPFTQISTMVVLLANSVAYVFRPVAFQQVAGRDSEKVASSTIKAIKYLGIFVAIVAGLLCGFGKPILNLWLGGTYPHFAALLWLVVGLRLFTTPFLPVFSVFQGFNTVRLPALVGLSTGLVNVLLTYLFLAFTNLGVWGVALATISCLILKNTLFATGYAARKLKIACMRFFAALLPGLLYFVLTVLVSMLIQNVMPPKGWLITISGLFVSGLAVSVMGWFFILKTKDRLFLKETLLLNFIKKVG